MTNDFKDSSMSLESYMKMDEITKEKLFCEIFDEVDVECMNSKTQNELRNEIFVELFLPKNRELKKTRTN